MSARRVTVTRAPIPFRTTFKHASASRKFAENVIVVVRDEDGLIGLGEGCPRPYVTNETTQSAEAFLNHWAGDVADGVNGVDDLRDWLARERRSIDANPSAACALELALLDLLARRSAVPVEGLLGLEPLTESPRASAVYSDGAAWIFAAQFAAFGWNGMVDAKLKLSGEPRRDLNRATRLAHRGRLRLDANNLWPDAQSATSALRPLARLAWAVEEPVAVRDRAAMRTVHDRTGLPVILDESLLTVADLEGIEPGIFVANLRVSKHGGLIRTLEVLQAAKRLSLQIVVGAQVGETSILARAGLAAVSAVGRDLAGYEGGYGLHLLSTDLCSPSLTFGRGGAFDDTITQRLSRPGLGIELARGSAPDGCPRGTM